MMNFLERHKKYIINIFIIFMIMQPIFDIYYLYSDNLISLFKFSPSTILRMIVMGLLVVFAFLLSRNRKKTIYAVLLGVIYILYSIFHLVNCSRFNIPFNLLKDYSFLNEIFYIIRMIMPLCLIFVTCEFKPNWEKIKKTIIFTSLIFAVIIIISNIFKFSLTSYSDGNKIIKANIFEWFNENTYKKFGYMLVASKGIFHMANQVSGILVALLPIVIYIYFEKESILKYITILFLVISMIMLGTRVASYGWILIMIIMLILYIFFNIISKKKINLKSTIPYILIILFGLIILPYSPVSKRFYVEENEKSVNSQIKDSQADEKYNDLLKYLNDEKLYNFDKMKDKTIKLKKQKFIKKYYKIFGIYELYVIDLYPYTEDVDFWIEEIKLPFVERANHRLLKKHITKRVFELNDNKFDKWFGISFTRLRNGKIYMENDIFVHFYSIGIFGICLFILPYFIVLLYTLYWMLKNKNNFTYINATYVFSICLVFGAGITSGNIFDEWIITLFLGFISGILINNLKTTKKEKKVLFISSTGGHLNELLQLKPLMKKYNSYLITEKTKSTIGLKKKFKNVNYLLYGTKDHKFSYIFKFLYNCIKSIILYIKIRPNIIITTGTHTAVPICYIGKMCGSKIIFIETFANSKTKTLSGRLIYPIANTFIVQWKDMLELYPKAIYGGWIY